MKRLSPRELLFVSAPLVIVGLGIWGARLREERWPTKPRVICQVRPAMPIEVFLGAQVGVTVEAIIPKALARKCALSLRYSLLPENQGGKAKTEVWSDRQGKDRGNYDQLQQTYAYNWADELSSQIPHVAEASLKSKCNVFPIIQQRFELSAKGVYRPNPMEAHQANFRVTKATLIKPTPSSYFDIELQVQDVTDKSQGLVTFPKTVGQWVWRDTKNHVFSYTKAEESVLFTSNTLTFNLNFRASNFPEHPAQGTKIRGLFSVRGGWPQEIEIEWPSQGNDMKFSTKLAQLPPSARN